MAEKIGIRPCVVLIKDEKVLTIHCKYPDGEYFLFPGGGVESGETLQECAIRETEEETGYKVKIKKLIYVNDWIRDRATNERVVNMFFLGEIVSGELIEGERDGSKVKNAEWVDLEKFFNIDFRPEYIAKRILKDYKDGFSEVPYFE